MLDKLKQHWKTFKGAPAGERFIRRYEANRDASPWIKVGSTVAGIALIAAGALMLVIPGPGIPVVAIGAALIAQQFRWAANFLDRTELFLRKQWARVRKLWKRKTGAANRAAAD
jgi:hypothetical protein